MRYSGMRGPGTITRLADCGRRVLNMFPRARQGSLVLLKSRLYRDYAYFRSHFAWDGGGAGSDLLLYHCYWVGALTQHHHLSLASLLVTQSSPFEVWLWMSPADIEANRTFLARFARVACVQVREYLPEREALGTILEGRTDLLRPKQPPAASDCLRTLVACRYGGVYFDLDVLFLRDLRPLCGADFFYQWSDQPFGNNALMNFRPNSRNARALLERAARIGSCHPKNLLHFPELRDVVDGVYVLPAFLFDPLWIAHDRRRSVNDYCNRFEDFFDRPGTVGFDSFFPGAYTYHWHNQWTTPIRPGTIAGRLYDEIDARLRATGASPEQ
jgi:Glycosyltransferase sugar-binding region containing DXD motif